MEELYEFVYGEIDDPLYYPKDKIGDLVVDQIVDWNGISFELRPKTISLQVTQIFPEKIVNNKKVTTVKCRITT